MIKISSILDVEKHVDSERGIIFDLDDTLYSEKEYVLSGYYEIARRFPQIPNLADKLWAIFLRGGKAIDEVFEAEGLLEYKADALRIYRYHKPNIHLYKGVVDMLKRLRQKGKLIGIVTDGRPEGQRAKLDVLRPKVDYVIITDELGGIEFRKPNPRAFEIMKEKMKLSYDQMIYVGDNPEKDFIAPLRLHMNCIFFVNPDGLYSNRIRVY